MPSSGNLAAIALLVLQFTSVCADLPVHCTVRDVYGTWKFSVSNERKPSMSLCSDDDVFSVHFEVTLQPPNLVFVPSTGQNGTFTTIYDEGMEIRIDDGVFFAYFAYTSIQSYPDLYEISRGQSSRTAKQTQEQWFAKENGNREGRHDADGWYVSLCHETSRGWYSQRGSSGGACLFARHSVSPSFPTYVSRNGKNAWRRVTLDDMATVTREAKRKLEDQASLTTKAQSAGRTLSGVDARELGSDEGRMTTTNAIEDAVFQDVMAAFVEHVNQNNGDGWDAIDYEFLYNSSMHELQHMAGFRTKLPPPAPPADPLPSFNIQEPDWRAKYPAHWDWRDVNGSDFLFPVQEQGSCGSCFAFAAIDMIQTRIAVATQNRQRVTLSVQDVVSCSPFAQGCFGGFPFLACKTAQELGVAREGCFPYHGHGVRCPEGTVGGDCAARTYIRDYAYVGGYYGAGSEEGMMKEILEYGPVAVAINVHSDMLAYQRGVYSHGHAGATPSQLPGWEVTNHAVLCVGWGEESGRRFWIVKNSWGSHWGEQGYIRIERGVDMIAIESMAVAAYV